MALYDCHMIGLFLTPYQPMRGYVDDMMAMERRDGVLSLSLAHCFPWPDVPTCGAYALAVTDDDTRLASELARELGEKLFAIRHALDPKSLPLDAALDKALSRDSGLAVVADQADNAGGGAPSDSTFVLRALLERGVEDAALGMMWDPIAVQVAMSAGVGAKLDLRLGGKMGPMSGDPLDLRVTVIGVIPDMKQQWDADRRHGRYRLRRFCGAALRRRRHRRQQQTRPGCEPGGVFELWHRSAKQAASRRQIDAAFLRWLRAYR